MSEDLQISVHEFNPGDLLDNRYKIDVRIAVGGMGAVYKATDLKAGGRKVAIKILHRTFQVDKQHVARFIQEAKILNTIDHINVVRTYDLVVAEGSIYLVTEFISGEPLDAVISNEALPFAALPDFITQICNGLGAVHRRGIVHRDLKPENILVQEDGTVKIIDFGAARSAKSRLTFAGQKIGSAAYIAPEVWFEKKITPAVDYYSLGVVLYEAVTKRLPFESLQLQEIMQMHVRKIPSSPAELNPEVPQWIDKLIMRLLSKDPLARPNASEIMEIVNRHIPRQPSSGQTGNGGKDPTVLQPSASQLLQEAVATSASRYPVVRETESDSRRTFVLQLKATKVMDQLVTSELQEKRRRKATVMIPLPRRAALVLEIESPSRDFLYFGLFLASLQVADGVLTSHGVERFGVHAEGNFMLRTLMEAYSPDAVLFSSKLMAIVIVVILTMIAKRMRWIKDLIGLLSCIYLIAAILPWARILLIRH